jgi:hypothetical protein
VRECLRYLRALHDTHLALARWGLGPLRLRAIRCGNQNEEYCAELYDCKKKKSTSKVDRMLEKESPEGILMIDVWCSVSFGLWKRSYMCGCEGLYRAMYCTCSKFSISCSWCTHGTGICFPWRTGDCPALGSNNFILQTDCVQIVDVHNEEWRLFFTTLWAAIYYEFS